MIQVAMDVGIHKYWEPQKLGAINDVSHVIWES